MATFALIEDTTNIVVNWIEWDEVSLWEPDAGHYIVKCDACDIGMTYDPINKEFYR